MEKTGTAKKWKVSVVRADGRKACRPFSTKKDAETYRTFILTFIKDATVEITR